MSADCKDFINSLLRKDPKERLGYKKDRWEVQAHSWLKDVNFTDLQDRKPNLLWKPKLDDQGELKYFDAIEYKIGKTLSDLIEMLQNPL